MSYPNVVTKVWLSGMAGVLLIVGCGGSGGPLPLVPTSAFRSTRVGDTWKYDVSIDFGQLFGVYPGTLSEVVSADTYKNAPALRDTRTFLLQLQHGPATITDYVDLSPSGRLLAQTLNGSAQAVVSDTFFVPSSLTSTTSTSGVITFANGTTFTATYQVVGQSFVQTDAGPFACWVVHQTVLRSDGTSDDYMMEIAPETGNYVTMIDSTIHPDGSSLTYTLKLKSLSRA